MLLNTNATHFFTTLKSKASGNTNGFTLVELMVSLAILGILVAIATPSYINYYAHSYRSDALRELVRIVNKQESYFSDQFTYTSDMTKLGLANDPYVVDSGLYTIDVVVSESTDLTQGYLLRATAKASQLANDSSCKTISIDHLGQKSSTDSDGNDSTKTCWY